MSRTKRRSFRYPMLFRPLALAHRPGAGGVTVLCLVLLAGIFVANLLTPVRVVFSSFALVPLAVAMWLLSDRQAALVGLATAAMVVLTGVLGIVNAVTALGQLVVFVACAVVIRTYANWMADVLVGLQQSRRRTLRAVLRLAWPRDRLPAAEGEGLTAREHEVAELAVQGCSASEMAATLGIGERTVESHLANVYAKLGVHSKLELVRFAARLGLRSSPEASSQT